MPPYSILVPRELWKIQHTRYQKDNNCVDIIADLNYCEQALQKHQNLYQKQEQNSMDVVNIQRTIGLVYATLQQFDQSLKY